MNFNNNTKKLQKTSDDDLDKLKEYFKLENFTNLDNRSSFYMLVRNMYNIGAEKHIEFLVTSLVERLISLGYSINDDLKSIIRKFVQNFVHDLFMFGLEMNTLESIIALYNETRLLDDLKLTIRYDVPENVFLCIKNCQDRINSLSVNNKLQSIVGDAHNSDKEKDRTGNHTKEVFLSTYGITSHQINRIIASNKDDQFTTELHVLKHSIQQYMNE